MAKVRTGLAKHGDGYFAMAQVSGKGQRGKTWVTEPGTNIILTLVMQPSALQLAQQFQFSAAIALAAHDFFAFYAGDETTIKWPNDIYWRDRKAGGILIENIVGGGEGRVGGGEGASVRLETGDMNAEVGVVSGEWDSKEQILQNADNGAELRTKNSELQTSPWLWAITGMGININQTAFPEHIRNAVSLKQITGKDWDVIDLAKDLCGQVQSRYEQLLAGDNLLQEYNNHLFKKGQAVKFKKGSRVFEAMVKEVNMLGELVVVTATEEHFNFGEIEWVL
jgi:BirA family biotin operon repressor/biotin-[acetyl-CoA-carboxylase] ligase